jgi:DNA polymerase I
MTQLTALVDADILVYQAALEAEHEHRWNDGLWTYHAYEKDGEDGFERALAKVLEDTKATSFLLALSEPVSALNWRLGVLPSYKGNRKNVRRPLIRKHLNQWVMDTYKDVVYLRPTLEGDDVLGILNTHPTLVKGDKLVVSIDKDFRTIPGKHYNQKQGVFFEVTQAEADRYHMYQTLIGDATDGYAGCPGVGPEAATKLLDAPYLSVPYEHALKSGPRKGTFETRYREEPTDDVWAAVVSLYVSKGLSEEEALRQARVARICRHTDYDFQNKKVKLWTPH